MDLSKFDTKDVLVQAVLEHYSRELNYLLELELNNDHTGFILAKEMLARSIRNDYGLWSYSPLTKSWRDNPGDRKIVNGIDYSLDHPEKVSSDILDVAYSIHKQVYYKYAY